VFSLIIVTNLCKSFHHSPFLAYTNVIMCMLSADVNTSSHHPHMKDIASPLHHMSISCADFLTKPLWHLGQMLSPIFTMCRCFCQSSSCANINIVFNMCKYSHQPSSAGFRQSYAQIFLLGLMFFGTLCVVCLSLKNKNGSMTHLLFIKMFLFL